MKFTIGIIGNGFVGGATKLLKCKDINVLVWDILPEKCEPVNLKISELKVCDFIFICVPTPMEDDGNCHTGIVESVVKNLQDPKNQIDFKKTNIIIRSTVPPGTSESLGCYFMPEFLTEANWREDFYNCRHWIIGSKYNNSEDNQVFFKFKELIYTAYRENVIGYNNVRSLTTKEAEMVKYVRNSFLAVKVSYFNEIYELCRQMEINYDNIRSATIIDDRIGKSHTQVPGPDGRKGFGGTCFPKDINALSYFYTETLNVSPPILSAAIYRNENIDRPERDWAKDKRAKI